ncbi:MAG: hypothetical protein ABSB35_26460 [Bryobacteraceae bacterium]
MPGQPDRALDLPEPSDSDETVLQAIEREEAERSPVEVLAENALQILHDRSDRIFYQDGKLVDVRVFADGNIEHKRMTKALLVTHLRRYLDWPDKQLGEAAAHIVHHADPQSFPRLAAIHTMPVLRPDFTLVPKGYDKTTGVLYVPSDRIATHKFKLTATLDEAKKAYKKLLYPFTDFPIAEEPDRVNAIAFVLTLVSRTAMDSLCPVLAIDASGQSSGKTLLGETFSLMFCGKRLSWVQVDKGLAEVEKGIKAALLNQERLIGVDNIVGLFKSPMFAGIVTGHETKIRKFGSLDRFSGTKDPNFILNGNNLKFDTDVRKRVFWVKMWHEDPASRDKTQFRVQQDHGMELDKFLLENWIDYYDAAMTIIQAWRTAGMPRRKPVSSLDKYGEWESVIGGMLEFVGVKNFLANHDERSLAGDEEQQELIRFMDLVVAKYPQAMTPHLGVPIDNLANDLMGDWKGVLSNVSGNSPESMRISLGKFLAAKFDQNIAGRKMNAKRKANSRNIVIRSV